MELSIKLPEAVSSIHNLVELKQMAVQGVVLMAYMRGEMSKMEAAEALGLDYDGITKLFRRHNIPTIMNLPEDLKKVSAQNRKKLAARLGLE